MNKEKVSYKWSGAGRGRGLFWGLTLVAIGSFWLLGSLEIVPEPAKVIVPGLVILWGLATIFTRRKTD